MSKSQATFHTTTVRAPLELFAELDELRGMRARSLGRRPLMAELIREALEQYLERELDNRH